MHSKSILLMMGVVVLNATATFFLKAGAKNLSSAGISLVSIFDRYIISGTLCYALAFIGYILALRHLPLFQAQSIAILQYLFVLIGSYWLFHEVMTPIQVMGCVLLLSGLVCVLFG